MADVRVSDTQLADIAENSARKSRRTFLDESLVQDVDQ